MWIIYFALAVLLGIAFGIVELTPQSREQSVASTKIEESVMWANAAIARNEHDDRENP